MASIQHSLLLQFASSKENRGETYGKRRLCGRGSKRFIKQTRAASIEKLLLLVRSLTILDVRN